VGLRIQVDFEHDVGAIGVISLQFFEIEQHVAKLGSIADGKIVEFLATARTHILDGFYMLRTVNVNRGLLAAVCADKANRLDFVDVGG